MPKKLLILISIISYILSMWGYPDLIYASTPTFNKEVALTFNQVTDYNAQLGQATALSGNTLAIGAPGLNGQGAVFIYERVNNIWTQKQELTGENLPNAQFGFSLAMDGDILAIGAPNADNARGAVYVFVKQANGQWSSHRKLVGLDTEPGHELGKSVAISGDTIVAGALGVTINNKQNAGAAYVFTGTKTGNWFQQQKLTAADAAAGDLFGSAVAIYGDMITVGAPFKASNTGAVYTFKRTGAVWNPQPTLVGEMLWTNFGTAIDLEMTRLVVTAPPTYFNFTPGKVYIYGLTGQTWQLQKTIVAEKFGYDENNFFGVSVSLHQDLIAVGAPLITNAVFTYEFDGTDWAQKQMVTPAHFPKYSDLFGVSVALGADGLAVGAPNPVENKGAFYVFERTSGTNPGPGPNPPPSTDLFLPLVLK